jgi:hypothetical protein
MLISLDKSYVEKNQPKPRTLNLFGGDQREANDISFILSLSRRWGQIISLL